MAIIWQLPVLITVLVCLWVIFDGFVAEFCNVAERFAEVALLQICHDNEGIHYSGELISASIEVVTAEPHAQHLDRRVPRLIVHASLLHPGARVLVDPSIEANP